jgi:hypothetical protein
MPVIERQRAAAENRPDRERALGIDDTWNGQDLPEQQLLVTSGVLWLLTAIGAVGLLLITAYGLRIVAASGLVAVPTALFLTVYLGAMTAAARLLHGAARLAVLPGALAVTVMLGFCGWALAIPAVVALAAYWRPRAAVRRERSTARPAPAVRCPGTAREHPLMASR